jgi:hypothetical protein
VVDVRESWSEDERGGAMVEIKIKAAGILQRGRDADRNFFYDEMATLELLVH